MTEISQVFIKIFNMSLNASFVVIAVLFLRIILRKIPKKYSYLLWIIVFLRFLWPFTVESVLSLVPVKSEPITYERLTSLLPYDEGDLDYGFDETRSNASGTIYSSTTATATENISSNTTTNEISMTTNRLEYIEIASFIWVTIALLLTFVSIVKFGKLKVKLQTATFANVQFTSKSYDRIYETDQIVSPFIIGIVMPRIYLPIGLSDTEKYHVVKHEQIHWKRKDYLVKLITFFAVILHWFNPLVWVSYYLLIKDMEMSCDEMVMEQSKEDIRQDYSRSLLSLSMKQSGLLSPLAFGESNTKSRVKNVLNFKKPSSWVSLIAILLVVISAATLLTNSKQVNEVEPQIGVDEAQTSEDITDKYTKRNVLAKELYKNRTNYIGDNSKVLALLSGLPVPEGLKYKSIELQTTTEPYELHVYYEDLDKLVDTTDNDSDIEFKNAMLLFATIENMGQYTIHRTYDGGESKLSYSRSELVELFGDLYSYSESPEKIISFMGIVDSYLDGVPVSVETPQYSGRSLTIGIIGEVPDVREEQVKFVNIQFSDLEEKPFQEQYDAIFITKDNLSEAAEDKYASIYKESTIPFFFIQSDKSYFPFLYEEGSYDEVTTPSEYYITGILYTINQTWQFGTYNNIENATNIKDAYSRIFETIEETPDPKAVAHVMSLDFRKILAEKLKINYENKNLSLVHGKMVSYNGITMTVGSTYNSGVVGSALLAFSKDNGEIFYNSMNPNIENISLKNDGDKELECLITTELSEDSKILFCYLSYVNTASRTYDLVSFNIQNLINNQSQMNGVTFKDEIIYGNWSSTIGLVDNDETIKVANAKITETVSMCGKELQIDSVKLSNNAVIINTTVLKDEGMPTDMDASLSSVSTGSGSYYGVYVQLVYEDGTTSDKIDCKLDEEGNIIAWFYEAIDMQSVKVVMVGDVSIEMKK